MSNQPLMVITTVPDAAAGQRLTEALLENKLAACIQTLPIQSSYRWKGAIQHDSELLLLIKTRAAHYPRIETLIRENHPYEVPEIIAIPVTAALPSYLQWILQETTP